MSLGDRISPGGPEERQTGLSPYESHGLLCPKKWPRAPHGGTALPCTTQRPGLTDLAPTKIKSI